MSLATELARSAGNQWRRERATATELRDLRDQTAEPTWDAWRIERGHSVLDFANDELPALMASHGLESQTGSEYLRIDWPNPQEAYLLRTPVLDAFVASALDAQQGVSNP